MSEFALAVLPYVVGLLAVLRFGASSLYRSRMRAVLTADADGPPWREWAWFVALVGLVAMPVAYLFLVGGALAGSLGVLAGESMGAGVGWAVALGSSGIALLTGLPIVLFALAAVWVDWARVGGALGLELAWWQRGGIVALLAPFLSWIVTVMMGVVGLVGSVGVVAEMVSGWTGARTIGGVDTMTGFAVAYGWAAVILLVVAYVVAWFPAGTFVWWFENRPLAFFRGWPRLAHLVLVALVAGIVGSGLSYVLNLVLAVSTDLVALANGAPYVPGAAMPEGGPVPDIALRLVPALVALPVAGILVRGVDWEAVKARLAWWPSPRERRLLVLALASWLVWPVYVLTASLRWLGR